MLFRQQLPAYFGDLFNNALLDLLDAQSIQVKLCRTVSGGAKFLDAALNEAGLSEKWDTGGLFSALHRTAYIASEGWQNGGRHVFTEAEKRLTAAHEIGGHAIDFCLGRPSHRPEFERAWARDIEVSFPYPEDTIDEKRKLCLLLDDPHGPSETWATFMEFALTGTYLVKSAHYFPLALEVFNRQCLALAIPQLQVAPATQRVAVNGREVEFSGRTLVGSAMPEVAAPARLAAFSAATAQPR